MGSLDGRVVLVTGGNGGIGLGIAKGCAAEGAGVVIWGTSADKLSVAETELRAVGATVLAQRVDVSDESAVIAAFAEAVAVMGRVDSAVANAGVSTAPTPFIDQTIDEWNRLFAVNVEGLFFTLREAARHMVDRGEGGALVGISSTSAIHGAPMAQSYAASKGAVLTIMRGLAVELARYGIRANSIVPGWTDTEMTAGGKENEKFLEATIKRTPIRRWGTPEDFGAVGAYLSDPRHVYHTGDEVVLDGGYTRF